MIAASVLALALLVGSCSLTARHQACGAGDLEACRTARLDASTLCAEASGNLRALYDKPQRAAAVARGCRVAAELAASGQGGARDLRLAVDQLDAACELGDVAACTDADSMRVEACLEGDDWGCVEVWQNTGFDCGFSRDLASCAPIIDTFAAACGGARGERLAAACERVRPDLEAGCRNERTFVEACDALRAERMSAALERPEASAQAALDLRVRCAAPEDAGWCRTELAPVVEACLVHRADCTTATALADLACHLDHAPGCRLLAVEQEASGEAAEAQASHARACALGDAVSCQDVRRIALATFEPGAACDRDTIVHERVVCAGSRAASSSSAGLRPALAAKVSAEAEAALTETLVEYLDSALVLEHDDFDDLWRLSGVMPVAYEEHDCAGCSIGLAVVWVRTQGREQYGLVLRYEADDWRFLDAIVVEIDGRKVTFEGRDVGAERDTVYGGGVVETLVAEIDRGFIKRLAGADRVRFRARGSDGQVTGVLDALDLAVADAFLSRLATVRDAL